MLDSPSAQASTIFERTAHAWEVLARRHPGLYVLGQHRVAERAQRGLLTSSEEPQRPGRLEAGQHHLPGRDGLSTGRVGDDDRGQRPPPCRVNAGITALGGLLFGYDTGMISGAALLFIGRDFPMSSVEKELLASSLLIGAAVGAPGAGKIADKVGRRPTVLGTAALFVVGVALAAFSPSYVVLLVAGW